MMREIPRPQEAIGMKPELNDDDEEFERALTSVEYGRDFLTHHPDRADDFVQRMVDRGAQGIQDLAGFIREILNPER